MSVKLQQHQHLDSNVASFGGTVTTTVSAAEGASLRSVEKNAVLTEHQLDEMYRRNQLQLGGGIAGGSDASLTSSGTGDSASGASSAASVVSSGVSTDSAELLERHRQLLLQQQRQQQLLLQQQQQQQQRFASLLTVERGPEAWASHAYVTFRFRSDRLYYLDSAGRLHGPMDQREQATVASVRRHVTRSSGQQPPVATRSHRTLEQQGTGHSGSGGGGGGSGGGGGGGGGGGFDDCGLLLLERRIASNQQQQQRHAGGSAGGGVYSRVQVNQYDMDWSSPAVVLPRSYSQQLEFRGVGGSGGAERELTFRRQHSRDGHSQPQPPPPPQQQHYQHYQRMNSSASYHHQGQHASRRSPHNPAFDSRLENLERSLNQAMESIRRQTSHHHRHRQQQQQQQKQQYTEQQQYLQQDSGGGELRRFNSEPPFEFRYSQRTLTHEPPQVTEEVETTTLQPIGRGIHDLAGGTRVSAQQSSFTEHRVSRAGRLTVRQPPAHGEAGGRSLSANRSATLRASTPVSPKLPHPQPPQLLVTGTMPTSAARGRHLSANAHREFGQVVF